MSERNPANPRYCPLCGGLTADVKPKPLVSSAGEIFPRSVCASCGCEWLSPRPSDEQLAAAYGKDYYGAGDTKFGGPVESVIQRFRDGRARAAMRLLPQGGSVLDIGCGNGGFLRSLARLGDYKLHGIELPGPAADRAATVPGIHLQRRPIAPGDYPSGSFDLITLFHVIEHLPAPADLFSQASTLLKPGGHLLLSLPNCGSWQARLCGQHWLHWDPPRHLWLAPPSALVAAGSRVGLLPERMSHLSLEQNPFGLLQGLLNHAFPRDRLYEWLKRSDPKRGKGTPPVLDLAFAILLGPACVVFSLAESVAGKGGTFELCLRKDADPTSADRGSA